MTRSYEPQPTYDPVGGRVERGWAAAAASVPDAAAVLAVDGPAILPWAAVMSGLTQALRARNVVPHLLDLQDHLAPWDEIRALTASDELPDDPNFATLATADLRDLFGALPAPEGGRGELLIVHGPGAALVTHDLLWYVDVPKRYAEAAIGAGTGRNLGQRAPDGFGSTKRLFYIDWPILDRHRQTIAHRIDLWIDVQDAIDPKSIEGATLRRTGGALARRPFRTRPTFSTASWGGHWGQRELGLGADAANSGLGYELIAPESGVLIGDDRARLEMPFQLIVGQRPADLLGADVQERFGASFPIRFDYLDTVDGGNLSVHCHPRAEYMRRVFGWAYPQHETYYVVVGGKERRIYLGLREGLDLDRFRAAADAAVEEDRPFDIERYVQTFPATSHQLFMIPAGTPHGSGKGNVVLEVSATPYLYSLRFYDWLRRDDSGIQRPVHVDHAFANLDSARRGRAVRNELIQSPRIVREGADWREELIGSLPDVFFEVRRLVLATDDPVRDDTEGRFHVLNVVDGVGIDVETETGQSHRLNYAETLVVPAAVGAYRFRRRGLDAVRIVKAFVR